MKVVVVGLRGIPGVQGGVETHVEHLYTRIAAMGHEVVVVGRNGHTQAQRYRGVQVVPLTAPRRAGLEAMVHTGVAVIWAAWRRADVVHVHAIGPGIWVPLARLLGLRVLFTHHGQDYRREKWGRFARTVLKLGERWAVKHASAVVTISREIQQSVLKQYGVQSHLIPNGVEPARPPDSVAVLSTLGVVTRQYVVTVGRLVPEKRQLDLVAAFSKLRNQAGYQDWSLVIVGSGDDSSAYVKDLRQAVAQVPRAILAGFRTGTELAALLDNAGVFCLPSSHEGLPIAMLEALSYGLPVVASDIAANLEVGLPAAAYARLGDTKDLLRALEQAGMPENDTESERNARKRFVGERYTWNLVAEQTLVVLKSISLAHVP